MQDKRDGDSGDAGVFQDDIICFTNINKKGVGFNEIHIGLIQDVDFTVLDVSIRRCVVAGDVSKQTGIFHGECPVAICCQNKGIIHCGKCADFPCELLMKYSCDPEHGDTPHGARIDDEAYESGCIYVNEGVLMTKSQLLNLYYNQVCRY